MVLIYIGPHGQCDRSLAVTALRDSVLKRSRVAATKCDLYDIAILSTQMAQIARIRPSLSLHLSPDLKSRAPVHVMDASRGISGQLFRPLRPSLQLRLERVKPRGCGPASGAAHGQRGRRHQRQLHPRASTRALAPARGAARAHEQSTTY